MRRERRRPWVTRKLVTQSVLVVPAVLQTALVTCMLALQSVLKDLQAAPATRMLALQSVLKVSQAALCCGFKHPSSLMALAIQTRAGVDVVRI